jgi:hypothetical protein
LNQNGPIFEKGKQESFFLLIRAVMLAPFAGTIVFLHQPTVQPAHIPLKQRFFRV